jgi:hypothetical protein
MNGETAVAYPALLLWPFLRLLVKKFRYSGRHRAGRNENDPSVSLALKISLRIAFKYCLKQHDLRCKSFSANMIFVVGVKHQKVAKGESGPWIWL